MLIQPNVMTIDKMYAEMDDEPVDAYVDMEYGSQHYRARVLRPLNVVNVGIINDIYGRKMKTFTLTGYRIDENGNRLGTRGQVLFNDDRRVINPEDDDDLDMRFYGPNTVMWLVPQSVDLSVVAIDWAHPSFVG